MKKEYLGDGAYVEPAGYGFALVITTSNGIEDTNRIVLEEGLLMALEDYWRRMRAEVID